MGFLPNSFKIMNASLQDNDTSAVLLVFRNYATLCYRSDYLHSPVAWFTKIQGLGLKPVPTYLSSISSTRSLRCAGGNGSRPQPSRISNCVFTTGQAVSGNYRQRGCVPVKQATGSVASTVCCNSADRCCCLEHSPHRSCQKRRGRLSAVLTLTTYSLWLS